MRRRSYLNASLKTGLVGAGMVFGAGCVGTDEDTTDVTVAGSQIPDINHMDSIFPEPIERLGEEIDASLGDSGQVNVRPENAICGQDDCPERVRDGIVQVAHATLGNSTRQFNQNNIWSLPYTFPDLASISYTLTKEEIWERYWVPFVREHNVVPICGTTPQFRDIMIGTDAADDYENVETPEDLEGFAARRTYSSVAAIVLREWGMNPVDLPWGDTVEGLRTGVVDGMETYISPALAYGMGESLAEVIITQWSIGVGMFWANLDWLEGLSEDEIDELASRTKQVHTEANQLAEEVYEERIGIQDSPPSDSAINDYDIELNFISDLDPWMEPVYPPDNQDLYSDIFESVERLDGIDDGQEFHQLIWDTARESDVPASSEDYEVDSWWDDHLSEMLS